MMIALLSKASFFPKKANRSSYLYAIIRHFARPYYLIVSNIDFV